jgi:hypothetical protein
MQPTNQNLVPFPFAHGITTGTGTTVELNSAYDHVITSVFLGQDSGSEGTFSFEITTDAEGRIFQAVETIGFGGAFGLTVPCFCVTQSTPALLLGWTAPGVHYAIFGYRVTPPGASLTS